MKSYPNLVWILVDSIRAYRTDADVRGKLPVMERFGGESVEFTTCVTTAPSTIMSVTAMMTGLPAYFLARNYDQFRFDHRHHPCLRDVLRRHGYASYAFLRGMETRLKFRNLLDPVSRRFWPGHLRHRRKWRNEDLNAVLERMLTEPVPRPSFFFFHFNPQTSSETKELLVDPNVSERVEETLARLHEAGFTSENTIFVLCSDHGFPDPVTGLTTDWEIKHRLNHDLVLTDDNILIPLYIRYPGCVPRTIPTPVSSLDLFPTLVELADIDLPVAVRDRIDGMSLVRLMETADPNEYPRRFFRGDARLMFQTGRATAIRSREWKYIRFHDAYRVPVGDRPTAAGEVLIDLERDPREVKNVLRADPIRPEAAHALESLRDEFERSERRAVSFQVDYLLARQRGRMPPSPSVRAGPDPARLLLLFEPGTAALTTIGVEAVIRAYPRASIEVMVEEEHPLDLGDRVGRVHRFVRSGRSIATVRARNEPGRPGPEAVDLLIVFVQDPSAPIARDLVALAKSLRSRRRVVVDCNFNIYRRHRYWLYRLRAFSERIPYMVEEPRLLLVSLRSGITLVVRWVLRKMGRLERWRAVSND